MDCGGEKVHFYVANEEYSPDGLSNEGLSDLGSDRYVGSITAKAKK